jgi:sulfate adenylyltransferase subunit 1
VFEAIVDDFRTFALRAGIGKVTPVPVSALAGDMVADRGDRLEWYRGPTLLQILETADAQPTLAQSSFRFPVQYVARPTASLPRGYMGRVESGSIAVGDAVTVLPSGRPSRVKQILTFDGKRQSAGQNDAITLVLEDAIDVSRGDMITRTAAPAHVADVLDATVCWFASDALDVRRKYVVRHTTREVRGMVSSIDHLWNPSTQSRERAPLSLRTNDIGQIQIRLSLPLCIDPYDDNRTTGSFILIDENTNNTVAAGMIQ